MTGETNDMTKPKNAKTCPICNQPTDERYKPGDAPLEPGEDGAIPDDSDEA